jgi:hypothetical protein
MKKAIIMIILIAIAAAAPALCDDVNIAPRCRVLVSAPANPAWDGKNLADNDIGPTKGWLGTFDPQNTPWARFILPYPATVTKIRVIPASYTELMRHRFSRPKKISVLLKGDKPEVREFNLPDSEDIFQDLAIGSNDIYEVSIVINEVYPGVKFPNQTGFQEVQIMTAPVTEIVAPGGGSKSAASDSNPVEETKQLLAKIQETATGTQTVNTPTEPKKKGELSADEQEILDLLRQLLQRLEQKFREE